MCITYRFYHLCGHTHRITTLPCAYTPTLHPLPQDAALSSHPGPVYRTLKCLADPEDSPEETRLFPTLCAKCKQVCIISEWLNRTPGGRLEVIRAWNKTHRPGMRREVTLESEITELESFDEEDGDTGSDATAVRSDRTGVTEKESSTTLVESPPRHKPASKPHKIRADISSLRERMVALNARVRQHTAELKEVKTRR
jgi:hypothetical protein